MAPRNEAHDYWPGRQAKPTLGEGPRAGPPRHTPERPPERRAVTGGDARAACALLAAATLEELEQSSGRPCAESVLDEVEPAGARLEVSRYGTAAQARYDADVLFLTDGPQGWRVTAAGCAKAPGRAPYDCQVSGG